MCTCNLKRLRSTNKKKAWQDYKASGKDKSMGEIKKKEYKLQKHQTKVLIRYTRKKSENERDERLTNNFRVNAKFSGEKLVFLEVVREIKVVFSNDSEISTEQPQLLQ